MKLCLTIGVSNSKPLSHLPGAITAAHEMRDWALQAGFNTVMITDEDNTPVTIARIREALLTMLPANDQVDLFVLHFAGHGFRSGAEQNIWLTSDWHQEMRAISVEALKRQLYRHGVKSLSIFGDACRSLPSDIETADIFGDPVLPRGPHDTAAPIIDRFSAVADGQQAYMLKGDGDAPSRCVFSTVLVEGLSGNKNEAFDKYLPDCVIPESLALFSKKRLMEIAEIYDLRFSPEFVVGIPREHAIYIQRDGRATSSPLPKWPAPPSRDDVQFKANQKQQTILADALEDIDAILFDTAEGLQASRSSRNTQVFRKHFRDSLSWNFNLIPSNCNLIIRGVKPKEIWSTSLVDICSINDDVGTYHVHDTVENAIQILVEFDDGVFASAVVYKNLTTLVSRDEKNEINWTCFSQWEDIENANYFNTIEKFQKGALSAEQVDHIAAKIRKDKHINPTLGAIASYLYDYTGDIDSIRRMAFFYCHYSQPIPFDVAFMGLLSTKDIGSGHIMAEVPQVSARPKSPTNDNLPHWVTRETNKQSGKVAGLWPWLRQGWVFMEDPEPQEKVAAEGLGDVAKFLLPSQFSSFKKEGARILIERFNMEPSK